MEKLKNIYVFLDNVPFASEGILYGLENEKRFCVKSYYPYNYNSKRSNIDISSSLQNCFPINYDKDFESFVKSEQNRLEGSLFISFGYIHDSFKWARKLSRKYHGNLYVISERPTCVKKYRNLKTPFVLLKHFLIRRNVAKDIDLLFATGNKSIKTFRRLGWPKTKLKNIYYCPLFRREGLIIDAECFSDKHGLDFIYSGRFTYRSKSPQRIIKYFAKNRNDRLFVIGNYGDDKDRFIKKCSKYKNIIFLGSKPFNEVVEYFKKVDCVLVPSTVDGWNINVNIAVEAKIPCVITNNCGSDEIVKTYKNGVVTKNNSLSFYKGINKFKYSYAYYQNNAKNMPDILSPSNCAKLLSEDI